MLRYLIHFFLGRYGGEAVQKLSETRVIRAAAKVTARGIIHGQRRLLQAKDQLQESDAIQNSQGLLKRFYDNLKEEIRKAQQKK